MNVINSGKEKVINIPSTIYQYLNKVNSVNFLLTWEAVARLLSSYLMQT